MLPGVINIYHTAGGYRAQNPNKCLDDAAILERELQKNPNHSRNMFYLAQTYFEAKDYQRAIQIYEKRSSMEGSASELFWSLYRIALIQQFDLQCSPEIYLYSYAKAFQQRPGRIEPLYYIASYYIEKKKHRINYWILKIALALPPLQETILVERWMTDWGIPYQLIQSAYNIGRYREAYNLSVSLLASEHLPSDRRKELKLAFQTISKASQL
jgi:tetratricopeptide (TPR) repeat protein